METLKTFLNDLLTKSASTNRLFKRNLLKEYLQVVVLDFIYSHPKYSELVFYGGSCLSHCFGLNRLSEDLDFVDLKKRVKISELAKDLEDYFRKNTDLELTTTAQKFRLHLKFPILQELKLAGKGESDLLYLKVEIYTEFDFCKKFKTEIIPLFKLNRSILVKTFDLPSLMATKIRAVFHRKWEKTDKSGKTLAAVKGRDYFDLMWYLSKDIKPNLDCIETIKDKNELKKELLKAVGKIDNRSIQLDLEQLIDNETFVKNLSKTIKDILLREIQAKL
ncbi:MAG: nucleotidyl transferase AbiEii/AbiGii toxin family protein [Candidatus Ratteibacteria bacterium]|nr:nucleotidyl transferase AbiEii/AbiGii toxin family protein [Candidatus Ratteibacteria bacterium]